MITTKEPGEIQVLVDVRPVQPFFIDFDIVQLLWSSPFKSPIVNDRK